MVDVRPEVIVRRPRRDVAAFMFDPANDARWTGGLVSAKSLTHGPLRKGSKLERTSKFLGRTFSYVIEVLDAEDDRFVEMRATRPFEMHVRYELEDLPSVEQGTRVSIRASGGGTGFFKLAAPLLARMVRRNIAADLERLKGCVEQAGRPEGLR